MSSEISNKINNHQINDSRPPVWIDHKPSWYQTAQKTQIAGRALITLGVALAAVAIGGAILFSGYPFTGPAIAITLGVVGGVGSLVTFSIGISLVSKKEFWKDPTFKMEKQKEIIHSLVSEGYNVAAEKYRNPNAKANHEWDWSSHELISTETIGKIIKEEYLKLGEEETIEAFLQKIESDQRNSIELMIQHGVISPSFFTQYYLQEIAENPEITSSDFIQKHGWGAFKDGRITADTEIPAKEASRLSESSSIYPDLHVDPLMDPQKRTMHSFFLEELNDLEKLNAVVDRYSTEGVWNLLKFDLATEAEFQAKFLYELTGIESLTQAFKNFQKLDLWKLLNVEIADKDALRQKYLSELNDQSITTFSHIHSHFKNIGFWKLFSQGIATSEEVRLLFLNELAGLESFNTVHAAFNRFDDTTIWKLLDCKIATAADLHDRVIKCFESTAFAAVINSFGWNLFAYNLTTKEDVFVLWRFQEYLSQTAFTNFYQTLFSPAKKHGLFTRMESRVVNTITTLESEYKVGEQEREATIKRATNECDQKIQEARSNKDKIIADCKKTEQEHKSSYDWEPSYLYRTAYRTVMHNKPYHAGHGHAHAHGKVHFSMVPVQESYREAYPNPLKPIKYNEWQAAKSRRQQEEVVQTNYFHNLRDQERKLRDSKIENAKTTWNSLQRSIDMKWEQQRPALLQPPYVVY